MFTFCLYLLRLGQTLPFRWSSRAVCGGILMPILRHTARLQYGGRTDYAIPPDRFTLADSL